VTRFPPRRNVGTLNAPESRGGVNVELL